MLSSVNEFTTWVTAHRPYILLLSLALLVLLWRMCHFSQYIRSTYRRIRPKRSLASKLWVCHRCWYYEYAKVPRICPYCEERRAKDGESWLTPELLTRGQPAKEKIYQEKKRVLDTETD